MSNSRRTAGTLWAYGALFAAMAGGAALIARERGWLDSLPQLKRGSHPKLELAASDLDDTVPSPFEPIEFDRVSGSRMSPSESDDAAPEPGRQDDARDPPRRGIPRRQDSGGVKVSLSLDDSRDDDSGDGSRSTIATAGFEENAPPAPSSSQNDSAGERNSSPTNKPAVAARPTDTTKAVGSARNGAATLPRGAPLMAPLMDRDRIEKLIEEGEFVEAQKELSRWYWQKPAEQE